MKTGIHKIEDQYIKYEVIHKNSLKDEYFLNQSTIVDGDKYTHEIPPAWGMEMIT